MDSLYEDFAKTALEDETIYNAVLENFTASRLKEFYLDNPGVARPAYNAFAEARGLVKKHPRCAIILAVTAMEVCFRDAILTPILHGSFNSKASADIVVKVIVSSKNQKVTKALLQILANHTGLDLGNYERFGADKPLGNEIREVQELRNVIVHQAKSAAVSEADRAVRVAECLIQDVFNRVVGQLGLHTHDDIVCGRPDCHDEEVTEFAE